MSTGLIPVTIPAYSTTTLTVVCPTGKRVLGGGYESSGSATVHPMASYPLTVDSWRVTLRLSQDTVATVQFRVYAVCATVSN